MQNSKYNKKMGDFGEKVAVQFLQKKGYKLIDTKVSSRYGEIDLICKKDDEIIFVEVKTRSSKKFGTAEQAVSFYKKQKILATIETYLQDNETELSPIFDVVIVEVEGIKIKIIHYENVELI